MLSSLERLDQYIKTMTIGKNFMSLSVHTQVKTHLLAMGIPDKISEDKTPTCNGQLSLAQL
jgi:hypothetical protein